LQVKILLQAADFIDLTGVAPRAGLEPATLRSKEVDAGVRSRWFFVGLASPENLLLPGVREGIVHGLFMDSDVSNHRIAPVLAGWSADVATLKLIVTPQRQRAAVRSGSTA
jgi:hypothetical protein